MTQESSQLSISGPFPEMAPHWAFSTVPLYRYLVFCLEATQKMDGELFLQTMYHLLDHHEMLRLRAHKEHDHMYPYIPVSPDKASVIWIKPSELSTENIPETQRTANIQAMMEEIYRELNNYEGQLSRFIYLDHGDQEPGVFLFIFHHAVFDAYSSSVLIRDFDTIYRQLSRGEEVRPLDKTTTYRQFIQRIKRYLKDVYYPQERRYWQDLVAKVKPLPVDYPENRIVSFSGSVLVPARPKQLKVSLSERETQQFYRFLPIIHAQPIHAIVASLVQACVQWTGEPLYLQSMDSGRALFNDLNLSRSIGDFALSVFMLLDLEKDCTPIEALRAIIQQMKAVPLRGAGRSFIDFAEDVASEAGLYVPENLFLNYFGRVDMLQTDFSQPDEQPLFRPSERYKEVLEQSLPAPLGYSRLEVTVYPVEGRLTFKWDYDEQLYYPSTIERLAQDCMRSLRSMIAYSVAHDRRSITPNRRGLFRVLG